MLIFLEGISGSGKTTISKRIAQWFSNQGIHSNLYLEGMPRPLDLAWCAYITRQQYVKLLSKYAPFRASIEQQTIFEGDNAIVAYTQVVSNQDFYDELANHEIFGGRTSRNVSQYNRKPLASI